jgi:hypothetical protein
MGGFVLLSGNGLESLGAGVFVNTPCRKLFKTEGFERAQRREIPTRGATKNTKILSLHLRVFLYLVAPHFSWWCHEIMIIIFRGRAMN